jgi:carboxylesterase type B
MNTVVKTRQGEVRGRRADGVHVFKGIPYASPPFGAHRLRPPQPVEPWSGVRGAMAFGRKSPQPSYPPPLRLLLPELADPGEDCLTSTTGLPTWLASGR